RTDAGLRTYLRVAPPPQVEGKLDLDGVDSKTLKQALQGVLLRTESQEESVEVVQPRRITIDGRINKLRTISRNEGRTSFETLLRLDASGGEVAVSFMGVLELIKGRKATAHQAHFSGSIKIVDTVAKEEPSPAGTVLHQEEQ